MKLFTFKKKNNKTTKNIIKGFWCLINCRQNLFELPQIVDNLNIAVH